MDFRAFENKTDADALPEPLPLAYQEMFTALEMGCKCIYGGLTPKRLHRLLSQQKLIQTSISLHKLYPGNKPGFHSILLYKIVDTIVYYHDPARQAQMSCELNTLLSATLHVGAALVYNTNN